MKPHVVVVGSFVQDLTWKCDAFPRAGETVVGTFVTGPGGKGSNQAVACGRTGVSTLYVGAVGADAFGREAAAFYRAEKIGARFAVKPREATGTAAILVNRDGQNEIIVALGANGSLARKDLPVAAVKTARVLVCQCESNLATTAHALKLARSAGVTTVLNPAPMRADFDPAMLRHVDILIPNETEFASLVNRLPAAGENGFTAEKLHQLAPAELHDLVRRLGVPQVIITLGSKGCFLSLPNGFERLPAHTGIKVVDTTGAGDAFVGGFAAGLVRFDGGLAAAARFGNAVAALSVTKFGTAPAMPRQAEIARFLRRTKPTARPKPADGRPQTGND